jgi:hypothetical protein
MYIFEISITVLGMATACMRLSLCFQSKILNGNPAIA